MTENFFRSYLVLYYNANFILNEENKGGKKMKKRDRMKLIDAEKEEKSRREINEAAGEEGIRREIAGTITCGFERSRSSCRERCDLEPANPERKGEVRRESVGERRRITRSLVPSTLKIRWQSANAPI